MKKLTHLTLTLLLACLNSVQAGELRSTADEQKSVAVTIYNNNLALIKDQRSVRLQPGMSTLAFRDVSAQMRPETALLRSLSTPAGLSVLEQNFDFDLLSPQKLLEKSVGQTVQIIRSHPTTGADAAETATVLAAREGVVLQIGERIETGLPGRLVFAQVPPQLRDRPTLTMLLSSTTAEQHSLELSYLTTGLSWRADYVAELGANDDKLDLSGWVTLTNTSGTSYRNAQLQLVAGDVQQVTPTADTVRPVYAKAAMAERAMAQEALLEYHLYTLEHSTTLADNQTKQVALLSASAVPARKEFVLRGQTHYYQGQYGDLGQKLKVAVYLEFDNAHSSSLGLPLPKGIVRVYKKDSAGHAQFVGEDRIDHTPKNEKVRLKLGDAFDVTAERKQTDFKKLAGDSRYNAVFESAYEVVLKNAKPEAVVVNVQEPMPGDWQVLSESQPHTKAASSMAVWKIQVPAQGSAKLVYRCLVRY